MGVDSLCDVSLCVESQYVFKTYLGNLFKQDFDFQGGALCVDR